MTLQSTSKYHHGDLRKKLIESTSAMIREDGLASVSLRKLAERTGVSRTAPYHHFKDKNELLAAVAEQGFDQLTKLLQAPAGDRSLSLSEQLEQSILNYIAFAVTSPTQYELMFGRTLWRDKPSERLQRRAKDCFREHANIIRRFHEQGYLSRNEDPLRLAQLMWSALHGLVTLSLDGIIVRQDDLEEISRYALKKLMQMVDA